MVFRNWRPEDVDTVREMLQNKKKYADIADHFGVNRNAVASFVRRHGMVGVSSFSPFGDIPKIKRVEAIKRGRQRPKPITPATIPKPAPQYDEEIPLMPPFADYTPSAGGVSFADMDFLRQCNWPVSPHGSRAIMFCGCRVNNVSRTEPYCPKHEALGKTASRPRHSVVPIAPRMGMRLRSRFS